MVDGIGDYGQSDHTGQAAEEWPSKKEDGQGQLDKTDGQAKGLATRTRQDQMAVDNKGKNISQQSSLGDYSIVLKADEVMGRVALALERQDGLELWTVLVAEIQDVFSQENIVEAMTASHGLTLTRLGVVEVAYGWADQLMRGVDQNGIEYVYRVILRQDQNSWRLFGTMAVEE